MTVPQRAADPPGPTRGLWLAVVGFGVLVNPLMLTGPLFMVQVYDRVLPARSGPTLVVLFALVTFVYAMMALLDAARVRLLHRLAARMRASVEPAVIAARIAAQTRAPPDPYAGAMLRDLDAAQRALASPAFLALLDLPWALAFLLLLSLVHPALGVLALGGGAVLVLLALGSQWRQRGPRQRALGAQDAANRLLDTVLADPEGVFAPSLAPNLVSRWLAQRAAGHAAAAGVADRAALDRALARAFRLFMQSAMMALGAWLALQGTVSAGLIVAASVFLGRALAPVEVLATHGAALWSARAGWQRLRRHLRSASPQARAEHPAASAGGGTLKLSGLVVTPPGGGVPLLRLKQVTVPAGQALGVIGPGGSGKTVLARALLGLMPVAAGQARLGIGRLPVPPPAVGYLPQRATLARGTIAENIARMAAAPDAQAVREAALAAGAEALIEGLPLGYDTPLDPAALWLAGGLVQRIALARALHGDPRLLVLDDPQLDAEGIACLNAAVRAAKARGACVVVLAHRPIAIAECDLVLALDRGAQVAFGPRDAVLRDVVRGRTALVTAQAGAGP